MELIPEDILKLLLAILIGGIIGAEREYHDKAAGLRTIILICVGSTLFTIFSGRLGSGSDSTRIAANIVTGIGFLGAGVIIRESGRVLGLTTAATIWLTASIGMGIGGGYYLFVGAVTGIMLIVLWIFPVFEDRIYTRYEHKTYNLQSSINAGKYDELHALIKDCGLRIKNCKMQKCMKGLKCTFDTTGTQKGHKKLLKMLLSDEDIVDLSI